MPREKTGKCNFRIDDALHDAYKQAVAEARERDLINQSLRKGPLLEMFAAMFVYATPAERAWIVTRCKEAMGRWVDGHPRIGPAANGDGHPRSGGGKPPGKPKRGGRTG